MLDNEIFPRHHSPLIMGILNITEDSFSDGGLFLNPSTAISHIKKMILEKADIIDIGAESSRPGSNPVPEEIELNRIREVLELFEKPLNVSISIDTSKSYVVKRLSEFKVDIINDIYALRHDKEMVSAVAEKGYKIVLMHMQGTPSDMQKCPKYGNIVDEILSFFNERVNFAVKNGIKENKIILDPGIGFGKSLSHNLTLMKNIGMFKTLGFPVLVGPSRKSFIGNLIGDPSAERIFGTAGAVAYLASKGIDIIRVHDVKAMKEASLVAYNIVYAHVEQGASLC